MASFSEFESRTGQVTCTKKDVFGFCTDLRNFNRFIQPGKILNWQADNETCSFEVAGIGRVTLGIIEKEAYSKVVFSGDALMNNNFIITLNISINDNDRVSVKVDMKAELNPVMKMVAAKPIEMFLAKLIDEMEKFEDWDKPI
jgi:carbon monoxide dehydrogenase subunit G